MTDSSRTQQFANWILGKKEADKAEEYEELPLAGNAIRAVADKKLKDRFEEWEKAIEILRNNPIPENATLVEYCNHLLDVFDILKMIVQRIAYAYLRAGDKNNEKQRKMLDGWIRLNGIFRARVIRNRFFWGTNEKMVDPRQQHQSINAVEIQKFQMGCDNVFFPRTDKVIAFSFKDLDVRPTAVTVIQTMGMPMMDDGSPRTITSSGGSTSDGNKETVRKPGGGPYPRRIENKVAKE